MLAKARAPTNIALIKYWGKNPDLEEFLVPTKSSVSFTVEGLFTETELEVEKGSGKISLNLNGKKIMPQMPEFQYVGDFFGRLSNFFPEIKNYDYSIKSANNFPTAAGFASSASGFAALASCLGSALPKLDPGAFGPYFSDEKKLSSIARLGSGSASRSIPSQGGLVIWKKGEAKSKKSLDLLFSSHAESLFPPSHWKGMRIIYAKVEEGEKKIKSRAGMKESVRTSPGYWDWVKKEEELLAPALISAVKEKDFTAFAQLTTDSSDSMHKVMRDTKPSIVYLNEKSMQIIDAVQRLNRRGTICAYTFDAGPNAVLFCLEENEEKVKKEIGRLVGEKNLLCTRPGKGPAIFR